MLVVREPKAVLTRMAPSPLFVAEGAIYMNHRKHAGVALEMDIFGMWVFIWKFTALSVKIYQIRSFHSLRSAMINEYSSRTHHNTLCNTFLSKLLFGADNIHTHGVLGDKVYSILSCRYRKVLKTIDWTVLFIKICNYISSLWRRISRRCLSRYAPLLDENLVNCRNIIT